MRLLPLSFYRVILHDGIFFDEWKFLPYSFFPPINRNRVIKRLCTISGPSSHWFYLHTGSTHSYYRAQKKLSQTSTKVVMISIHCTQFPPIRVDMPLKSINLSIYLSIDLSPAAMGKFLNMSSIDLMCDQSRGRITLWSCSVDWGLRRGKTPPTSI